MNAKDVNGVHLDELDFDLPDLPMPPERAPLRHYALIEELTSGRPAQTRPRFQDRHQVRNRLRAQTRLRARSPAAALAAPRSGPPSCWKARNPRRLAVPIAIACAAALGVAVTVGDGADHGGVTVSDQVAFINSWTSAPAELSSVEKVALAQKCLDTLRDDVPMAGRVQVDKVTVTGEVAEQRGDLALVMLTGAQDSGLCAVPLAEDFSLVTVTATSTQLKAGETMNVIARFGEGLTPTQVSPKVGPGNDGPMIEVISGRVSAKVSRVVLHTSDGRTIQASVGQGYYLAWWPGNPMSSSVTTTTAYAADGSVVAHLTGNAADGRTP